MVSEMHTPTIGEVISLVRGTTYKSALLGQPGPVLLGLASIQRNGGFRDDSLKTYSGESKSNQLLKPGDLFVSLKDVTQSADLLGAVARVPAFVASGRLTQDTVKLDFGDSEYPRNLVYWTLRTPQYRAYCRSHSTGTTNLGLPREDFLAYRLPAPTSDALSLVEALEALDDRVANLRQTNAKLQAIATSLFKSRFVDFGGVPPEDMQESELGLIPKGWRAEEIGKLVQCVGGATPSTKDETFWNGGIHHWATPKDLSGLQAPVLMTTERRITDAGVARISSGLLPAGTLLMSSRAPIGYLAIAVVPVAINQGFIAMLPGGALSPVWLLFWAQTNMEAIKQKANGSTFMEISKAAFRPIKVALPPSDALVQFDEVVTPMLERIQNNERHIATLAAIRDTLLPRLLSGQLRVNQ